MAASGPATPAGYSGTPLHRKLGITPGARVLAAGVPPGWDLTVLDPDGTASVTTSARHPPYDVVVAFCPDLATLESSLPTRIGQVTEKGRLWVCWPKRASGVRSDLDDNVVRGRGLAAGVVDVKVCAVDATWSALCFMTRLRDRTGP
ncbi:MAG: hypothetical protein ACJ71T_09280 [Actinomycetales bacterium]